MNQWNPFDHNAELDQNYADFYEKILSFIDTAPRTSYPDQLSPDLPKITGMYLSERVMNAKVRNLGGEFEIGIHASLPCIIHYYFNNILRSRQFLEHLGSTEKESPYRDFSKTGIPLSLPDSVSLREAIPGIVNLSSPVDKERARAATLLTQIALSFCIYHEICHVELGHINALSELFFEEEFIELFETAKKKTQYYKIRRVWEYEADKVAAIMVISDLLHPSHADIIEEAFQIDSSYPYDIVGLLISAVTSVFHLFSQSSRKFNLFHSSYLHPHPMVRFASVSEELISFLSEHHSDIFSDEKELREVAFFSFFTTYDTWKDFGLPDRFNIKKMTNWKRLFREVDKLEKNRIKYSPLYRKLGWYYPFTHA